MLNGRCMQTFRKHWKTRSQHNCKRRLFIKKVWCIETNTSQVHNQNERAPRKKAPQNKSVPASVPAGLVLSISLISQDPRPDRPKASRRQPMEAIIREGKNFEKKTSKRSISQGFGICVHRNHTSQVHHQNERAPRKKALQNKSAPASGAIHFSHLKAFLKKSQNGPLTEGNTFFYLLRGKARTKTQTLKF